jgi:reactive intermediate/imine deaminase
MSARPSVITTSAAPLPAGHYSQAIVANGFIFVAGQLPIEIGRAPDPSLSIERQVELVMANIDAILAAAGSGRDRIVSMTVYITDVALWPRVNAAYAAAFGEHRPARTTVPVAALHHGFAVEMQAVAAL